MTSYCLILNIFSKFIYIQTAAENVEPSKKLITESYLMLAFQIFHTIPIALWVLRSNIYSELLITGNRIITHSPTAKTRLRMSHDLCREMCLRWSCVCYVRLFSFSCSVLTIFLRMLIYTQGSLIIWLYPKYRLLFINCRIRESMTTWIWITWRDTKVTPCSRLLNKGKYKENNERRTILWSSEIK